MLDQLRKLRTPILVALTVSLALGTGLGWKIHRDRAARLGVVTSSRKLRILSLTGVFSPAILRGFRSSENIEVELIEENSPDAVVARLDADPGFDLVTLMTSQLSRALLNSRIQPINVRDLTGFTNVSRDFIDLPAKLPAAVPLLWGVLGFAYNPSTVDGPIASWSDVFDLDRNTRIELKPMAFETLRLARKNMPQPFAENALQDRVAKLKSMYQAAHRFLVDPLLVQTSSDVVELSLSEASIPAFKSMTFVLPDEGALVWILNLALTSGSKNQNEGRAFASYVLKPEVAVQMAIATHEASTHLGVEDSRLVNAQKPSSLRKLPLTQLDLIFDDTVSYTK